MATSQNIFYTAIADFYSGIFPYKPQQLSFVVQNMGSLNGKSLLDIGCATGELSYRLAQQGANVIGMDLNDDLLHRAQEKEVPAHLSFRTGNMLFLKDYFVPGQFDGLVCFGNTLVHLNSLAEVGQTLKAMRDVLKSGAPLLLQILNYDYILQNHVSELPVIENDAIIFKRFYDFEEKTDSTYVKFNTQLEIKSTGLVLNNSTPLLALQSETLKMLLHQSGFTNISLYADFKHTPFGGKHLPLVLSCR